LSDKNTRPPRGDVIRAVLPGIEYRDDTAGGDTKPTLFGHFARFNEWTEIRSSWEGNFMERFVPGAFRKTIRDGRQSMKVLFQHGQDPELGDKPIAAIQELREDDQGTYYEASLFDGLPQLLVDGLRAGVYGASFRFGVVREEINERPGASETNPNGLPERTVKEAKVAEFGPVTFPAYAGATSGVRSMTDDFIMGCFRSDPDRLRDMFDAAENLGRSTILVPDTTALDVPTDVEEEQDTEAPSDDPAANGAGEQERRDGEQDAPSEDDAETPPSHLADERRETDNAPTTGRRAPIYGQRRKETSKPWLLGPSKTTRRI
jgi:hypothetical protein